MGNLLYKSADAENEAAVAFATEANRNVPGHELYVVHNTLVTDRPHTVLVRNHSTAVALVANNLVQGDALPLQGNGNALSNLVLQEVGLRNLDRFDYRLSPLSPAVDAALQDLATGDGKPLIPSRQYLHPRSSEPRSAAGARDIGAYEFLSEPTSSK